MTCCTLTTTAAPPFAHRVLGALRRYFQRSVTLPAAVDQAWLDSGLGRLNRATLEDIGAPPALIAQAELRESWRAAWTLESVRRM